MALSLGKYDLGGKIRSPGYDLEGDGRAKKAECCSLIE
jgi:hypothetical protein